MSRVPACTAHVHSQTIDGRDIRELNIKWLRAQIGCVSQEPVLFNVSVRDNIAYGDNTRTPDMTQIVEAARKANIDTFIRTLPQVTRQ